MPEGHTLYRLARDLQDAFGGAAVRASSPQGRFAEESSRIDGHVVEYAESAGKHLFVGFDNDVIVHIHLGLIGRFTLTRGDAGPPVGAVRLRIEGNDCCADLRGATVCELVTHDAARTIVAGLGADPLRDDADPDKAYARIRKSSRTIASLLLDQAVVAGVGNVFRAELLFRHRLHPMTPGTKVSRRRWNAMWSDLVELMAYGVRTGRIDTVRPEHEPAEMGREPRVDDHGGEVYVYRRQGAPCYVCGSTIRTSVLEQRNLFWCPRCQRRR